MTSSDSDVLRQGNDGSLRADAKYSNGFVIFG